MRRGRRGPRVLGPARLCPTLTWANKVTVKPLVPSAPCQPQPRGGNDWAGTGKMAQWVKCLLSKCEDLSSGPQHPGKKMGMVACVSDPRAGKEEEGGSQGPAGPPA